MENRVFTYRAASARMCRAEDGLLLVRVNGILTCDLIGALRRDVNASGENLHLGVVVDLRNAIHAVTQDCLRRNQPTPRIDRVAVAMLVKPADLPLWREYARRASHEGLLRRAFTDAVLACAWAERRALAQVLERARAPRLDAA